MTVQHHKVPVSMLQQDKMPQFETKYKGDPPLPRGETGGGGEELQSV